MSRFHSEPLDIPTERSEVVRADLIFYGVDHSGPTYEARIFLDNPRATEETALEPERGFAGAFTVFGHGGCFGGDSHCATDDRNSDDFDRRPVHPLTPQTVSVSITEALTRIEADQVRVHVVAVIPEGVEGEGPVEILPCDRVRLVTYA